MQLSELMRITRFDLDDTVQPYLWSDDELIEYANDAELEAARRARLLVDSSDPDMTQLDIVAGTALYALDPRVLFVRRARFAGALPLKRMNMQDMESSNALWQDAIANTPTVFVPDYETGKLLLWPTPVANGVLLMTVVRDPRVPMNDPSDTPEIAARYHRSLRFWMKFRAYMKEDAETYDAKRASDNLALFEQEFGMKSSALDEAWIAREQMELDGTF